MLGSEGRPPLRVVVCDDHALMRSALRLLLTPAEGLEVVGEAADGVAVLPLVATLEPDVVLLDLHMPGCDGFRVLAQLREAYPHVRVVVLSAVDDPEAIDTVLRSGASGYVLKSVNPLDLAAVVRQSVEATVFRPEMLLAGAARTTPAASALSEKESAVLAELAKGRSNRQIAQALWLSEQTVKFHLRNVYRKLGVANRTEALRLAHDRHLVAAA